ncbi:MAG: aminotransferase class IV [Candidatus Kerfeldbacteria bacterium]|nr:aminotransferase class IV [Candidatus Kerfeldbacteria bacterium]
MTLDRSQHHNWAWLNGAFMPYADALVPLGAHALHYGTSCFEGIRAYRNKENGRLCVWMLPEHVDRMYRSASEACVPIAIGPPDLTQAILDIVALNDDGQEETMYIRPVAFMNVDPATGKGIGVDPGNAVGAVGILTQPWRKYLAAGMFNDGATAWVSHRARLRPEQARTLKQASMYGITSVPAKLGAKSKGATEALCIDQQGHILDGTGQTIFAVVNPQRHSRNSVILTPDPDDANILAGTTATFFFERLEPEHQRYRVVHVPGFTLRMLRGEIDGLGFLGTATEVMPITQVWADGEQPITIGDGQPHPLVKSMQQLYAAAVRGAIPEYRQYISVPSPRDKVLSALEPGVSVG